MVVNILVLFIDTQYIKYFRNQSGQNRFLLHEMSAVIHFV